jgi:L-cystine transport system substrate-binding protein
MEAPTMKSSKLIVILTVAMALLLVSACSNNNNSSNDAPTNSNANSAAPTVVKVSIPSVPFPGFNNIDANGKQTGYNVDYLELLEQKLPEYKFDYETVDYQAMLIGTDTGKYDLAASVWFKNAEREQKYIYNHEYGYSLTVLATKEDRNDIQTLDDLVGKKIVPFVPTSGLRSIILEYNRNHQGAEITIEDIDKSTVAGDLKQVASGKYDVDYKNLSQVQAVNKELDLGLKVAGIVSKESAHFIFNKNKAEFAQRVEDVTKELIADGTLSELAVKWFGYDFFLPIEEIQQQFLSNN